VILDAARHFEDAGMKKDECRACGRCCMVFEIGPLRSEEADSGRYQVYEDPFFEGDFHMKKHMPGWAPEWAKQGVCVYLGPDMKCTIYEDRPDVCREFACRRDAGDRRRYLLARRHVPRIQNWTEYEREAFGEFLKEAPVRR